MEEEGPQRDPTEPFPRIASWQPIFPTPWGELGRTKVHMSSTTCARRCRKSTTDKTFTQIRDTHITTLCVRISYHAIYPLLWEIKLLKRRFNMTWASMGGDRYPFPCVTYVISPAWITTRKNYRHFFSMKCDPKDPAVSCILGNFGEKNLFRFVGNDALSWCPPLRKWPSQQGAKKIGFQIHLYSRFTLTLIMLNMYIEFP